MSARNLSILTTLALLSVSALSETTQAQTLTPLGFYQHGSFDEGAAEIAAYDAPSQQLFVTNAEDNTIDRLDISAPASPKTKEALDLSNYGGGVNSVATNGRGLVAVAVEADSKQDPGSVVFFTTNGEFVAQVEVGALPDMVAFTMRDV